MSTEQPIVFEWDGELPIRDEVPRPISAGDALPQWYQNIPMKGENGGSTVKLCAAFGDAIRMGWIIPLPFDLSFIRGDTELSCTIADSDAEPTVYGPTTATVDANSSFRPPELKIPNPWKIHTPDGYSTLVTYPRNREDNGIKPYSMFVPTDTYDGPINIPVSTTETRADIPAGVPFIHVIPFNREHILSDFDVTNESESPQVHQMWHETHVRASAENGYYRRYCWVPKEKTTVNEGAGSVENALGDVSEQNPSAEPDHTPKLWISDDLSGIVPEPVVASQDVPPWITDSDVLPINGEDEKRLRSWAFDLMQLGWNMPVVADMMIHVENGDISLDSEFSESFKRGEYHDVGTGGTHPPFQMGEKYSTGRPSVGKIQSPWFTCTPPGYSVFQTEPFNHRQQFHSSYTGIGDTDRYVMDANLLGKIDLPDGTYRISHGETAVTQIAYHRDSMLTDARIVDSDSQTEQADR